MEKSYGAIIHNKNDILLIKQTNNIVCFPKGHAISNEKPKDTILREVYEELKLNITLKNTKYDISYFLENGDYKNVSLFEADSKSKKFTINKQEVLNAYWINKDKICDYLSEDNLKMICSNNNYINKKITLNKKQFTLFTLLIKKYKTKYSKIINELKKIDEDNLKKYNIYKEINLINKYNTVVKQLLKEIADEFYIFKLFNVTIYITGSFARGTNKLNSDIDIHFIYNNLFKKFIWKYEEIYFCIISEILNIKRNNIHSVITTKLSERLLNYYDNLNDNKYLYISLKNKNDFNYRYLFYPITKKRFILQYKNSKNYRSFKKYLKKEILNNNREWAHNFFAITNQNKFDKTINNLKRFENNNFINKNIDKILENIINSKYNSNDIKDIKKYYQQITFGNIFNTLNIVRQMNNITYLDIQNLLDNKIVSKYNLKKDFYEYLWLIRKLALYCEKNNIIYSIHISNNLNIDIIKQLSNKQKIINEKLLNILNDIKEGINNGK